MVVYYPLADGLHAGDLILDLEKATVVLAWRVEGTRRVPHIAFSLDPSLLRPLPTRPGEFIYKGKLRMERAMNVPNVEG